MNDYLFKVKGFGIGGGTKIVEKLDDNTGEPCGTETHHWDDRIDATANLKVMTFPGNVGHGDNDGA